MTFPEAETAGHVTIRLPAVENCTIYNVVPASGGDPAPPVTNPDGSVRHGITVWSSYPFTDPYTIDEIEVANPAIYTISGIHVGSTFDEFRATYPNAVERIEGGGPNGAVYRSLRITNPEGRTDRVLRPC